MMTFSCTNGLITTFLQGGYDKQPITHLTITNLNIRYRDHYAGPIYGFIYDCLKVIPIILMKLRILK